MNAVKIMIGMSPFFLFSLLSPVLGVGWAATIGTVAAAVVVATTARGGVQELPVAQAGLLVIMAVIGFTGDRQADVVLVHYGPAIAAAVLGVFMIATARTVPFTAQYARTTVPPEFWHSRLFLDVNRRISTAWGLAILFSGFCHLLGAQIGVEGLHLALRLTLNQVLPILGLLAAGAYTKRAVAAAHRRAQEKSAHGAHEAGPVSA